MASVSLGIDPSRFEQIKRTLAHIPGGAEKAIARALNKTLEAARNEAIENVTDRYTIHPNILKGSMRIVKASPTHLAAALLSRGYGLPISKFKMSHVRVPRQKGIPVALREKVSGEIVAGASKEWSHGFLARMKSGHLGLWTRSDGLKSTRGKDLITEQFSLAVPQMISARGIITEIVNAAKLHMDAAIDREMLRLLEGGQS